MREALPVRLTDAGRTATWNPGLSRAARVIVVVRLADGGTEERHSMNSGRARVRGDERIEAVVAVP